MSAAWVVPSARAPLIPALVAAAVLIACAGASPVSHRAVSRESPSGGAVAFAEQRVPCEGACWSLHIGAPAGAAERVLTLAAGETCTEIAWTADGRRVAFLIDGYQLRIYDARTLSPAGQVNVIEPSGRPPERIVRGVTFSENGRAVTFDDCPRERSGCRAGLAAVPVPVGE
ncbi:MAG TPA: hypothetical protein VLD67_02820 [Vicinamibacterales bacterium]|nr:hypothetical protein [Vicinamibacterales bacterium]